MSRVGLLPSATCGTPVVRPTACSCAGRAARLCHASAIVLHSLLFAFARFMLEILIVRGRPRAKLEAEVLALRHQLRVLERQVGRPRWQPTDRVFLAAFSGILPRPDWRSLVPSPQTLLRWHRELVRRKWAAYRRLPRRRRRAPSELHKLILRVARENDGWGFRRIQGELLKLGYKCSPTTVKKVLRRHGVPPAPQRSRRSWREFVRQHADQMLACDFFTVDTVWMTRLCVFFFIEIGSRRVHLAGCTYSPNEAWVVQHARNLAWKLQEGELGAKKFLLRDRDSKFTAAFDEVFGSEGVQIVRVPYRTPRANSVAERFVGTVRRECLDHLLIFGRRHLEGVMTMFLEHYQRARPHQGIDQRRPWPPPDETVALDAPVERIDRLGGLLHDYRRAA